MQQVQPQAFSIDHAGPPPIYFADGSFDAQATATLGHQMGRVHMARTLAAERGEVNLRWHMSEHPPIYDPVLARYNMDAAQYNDITESIYRLFTRNSDKNCQDTLFTFATCLIYTCFVIVPRDKKDIADMLAHLSNLNATWNPHGITFNREFIPYMGTFCIIKTF